MNHALSVTIVKPPSSLSLSSSSFSGIWTTFSILPGFPLLQFSLQIRATLCDFIQGLNDVILFLSLCFRNCSPPGKWTNVYNIIPLKSTNHFRNSFDHVFVNLIILILFHFPLNVENSITERTCAFEGAKWCFSICDIRMLR